MKFKTAISVLFLTALMFSQVACKEGEQGAASDPFFDDKPGFSPDLANDNEQPNEEELQPVLRQRPEVVPPVVESEFEFDEKTLECKNSEGEIGLNVLIDAESLQCADASGQEIVSVDLSEKDLRGVDFTESLIEDVSFENSDLNSAIFDDADLNRVILVGANLKNSDFNNARITESEFDDAVIEHLLTENVTVDRDIAAELSSAGNSGADGSDDEGDVDQLREQIKAAKAEKKVLRDEMQPDVNVLKAAQVEIKEKRVVLKELVEKMNSHRPSINLHKEKISAVSLEIKEHHEKVKAIKEQRNELHQKMVQESDEVQKELLRSQILVLKADIQGVLGVVAGLKTDRQALRDEMDNLLVPVNLLRQERKQVHQEIKDIRERVTSNRETVKKYRKQLNAIRDQIKEMRAELKRLKA